MFVLVYGTVLEVCGLMNVSVYGRGVSVQLRTHETDTYETGPLILEWPISMKDVCLICSQRVCGMGLVS